MYCRCGSIHRARQLFDQLLPSIDHVTYSTLMKTYLSLDQPVEVLQLFNQFQVSSIPSDAFFYLNIINAGNQLGLMHQAKLIHRSIPEQMIEKNFSLQTNLIDMHAHCGQLDEAYRLFDLLKQKDNHSLANLLHGYALQGQGKQALKIYREHQSQLKFNEEVYRSILQALTLTGGLVQEARAIYQTIPDVHKTSEVVTTMVRLTPDEDLSEIG